MRRICPKCGNNTFITSAHVMQDWEVDAEGNYLDTVNGCVQVDQDPDQDNSWSCSRCGEYPEDNFTKLFSAYGIRKSLDDPKFSEFYYPGNENAFLSNCLNIITEELKK